MAGTPFTTETSRAANAKRHAARRAAEARAQFDRDLRGDHDGVASYAWLPNPLAVRTYLEAMSEES